MLKFCGPLQDILVNGTSVHAYFKASLAVCTSHNTSAFSLDTSKSYPETSRQKGQTCIQATVTALIMEVI